MKLYWKSFNKKWKWGKISPWFALTLTRSIQITYPLLHTFSIPSKVYYVYAISSKIEKESLFQEDSTKTIPLSIKNIYFSMKWTSVICSWFLSIVTCRISSSSHVCSLDKSTPSQLQKTFRNSLTSKSEPPHSKLLGQILPLMN